MKRHIFLKLVSGGLLLFFAATNSLHAVAQTPPPEQLFAPLQPAKKLPPVTTGDLSAAASLTLYPSDDAPVREGSPNSINPNQGYLGAGYDNGSLYGSTGRVRSYLRFDLSGLPADSIITSASLRVYQAGGRDYPSQTRPVTMYRVTGGWAESSLNWNNRPGYAESLGSWATTYDYLGWKSVDVTSLARNWVSGATPNYGVVLVGPESTVGIYRLFFARDDIRQAQLVINYQPPLAPVLDVSPGTASRQSTNTHAPFSASIHVENVTSGSLTWTAAKVGSTGWFNLTTSTGSATPLTPGQLTFTVNPAGLTPGRYSGQIAISSNTPEVIGSPLTATVQLDILQNLSTVYLPLVIDSGSSVTANPNAAALVIGIADYQYLGPQAAAELVPDDWGFDLFTPDDDARDMAALLQSDFGFPAQKIITNQTSPPTTTGVMAVTGMGLATRANIVAAFGLLDSLEDEDTTVIIYYSGHGGQVLDTNGDETDGYDEFIAAYDTNTTYSGFTNVLTDDDLELLLANLESKHIIVIIDSCYSGGLMTVTNQESGSLVRRGLSHPALAGQSAATADEMGLAELTQPGRLIITAGTGTQSTWESLDLNNGVFTYFYLAGLRDLSNDANQNEQVSLEEAFWFTKSTVDDWVFSRQGEHQNPDITDQLFGQVNLR